MFHQDPLSYDADSPRHQMNCVLSNVACWHPCCGDSYLQWQKREVALVFNRKRKKIIHSEQKGHYNFSLFTVVKRVMQLVVIAPN